jgi:hypothetical protein
LFVEIREISIRNFSFWLFWFEFGDVRLPLPIGDMNKIFEKQIK